MKKERLRCISEGAVLTAVALVLSYLKIPTGGFGGAIDLAMVPVIIYAVRRGLSWGLCSGLILGTLQFFLGGGTAVNWQSMLLDYSVAYMFVGFAGLMKGRELGLTLGALIGCLARFFIHFLSGITIYAEYMPPEFLGIGMKNTWIYSLLYNGTYMLPSTILAMIVCAALTVPLKKLALRETN